MKYNPIVTDMLSLLFKPEIESVNHFFSNE